LEAFEAFDQQTDARAVSCLKYVMLSQILQVMSWSPSFRNLGSAICHGMCLSHADISILALLALQGAASEVTAITSKHGLKYSGEHMQALLAIASAAKTRSLEVSHYTTTTTTSNTATTCAL